jgi:ubiquinone/menaquinone biosynthesis C-methylase UbiE
LPYADESFDSIVSTFALAGIPDAEKAIGEMARVLRVGGRVVLLDIALPNDGNCFGQFWARLWENMGDYLYNQVDLVQKADLSVISFEEFGSGKHIRVICS